MAVRVVDLRSDTVTKPTVAMREAMAKAVVGDDVYREDPTVIELEDRVANFLGKEAALFFPSGTMSNLAAIMAHCWTRSQEMIVGDQAHMYIYEQGGSSQVAGVHVRPITTKPDGTFDLDELESKIRPTNDSQCHEPWTGLICLENTHNRCGGRVLPVEFIRKVCAIAKAHHIPVHMDGARIINAEIYTGVPAATFLKDCDSVSMCISKGIGAPVGSLLAGSKEFIGRAMRCRKVLGGGLRQVGVLAAAGLVALDTAHSRMKIDHERALRLAKAIQDLDSELVSVDVDAVQSNMVLLNFKSSRMDAKTFVAQLQTITQSERKACAHPVIAKTALWHGNRIRCVLHSDLTEDDVDVFIMKAAYIVSDSV